MKVCENCIHYDGRYCTREWNNLDPCYCNHDRDKRNDTDTCNEWEFDGMEGFE